MRTVRDQYLPPDREAFLRAEPSTGRVIVIAPTRAACETIELAVGLNIDTYLERMHGAEVRELAASGRGFGIMAGTGTGKTLAIRPIAETILGTTDLRVGVVNREREATPELPTLNVIIVTTGIARRWFQDGDILNTDTLVVDEIHQTSAELELCLALGKRVGCRFIWLSATVDPAFYSRYLNSARVLEVYSFDPKKAARVEVERKSPPEFLDAKFLQRVVREKRGVGVFLPTRAGVEQAAGHVRFVAPRINTAFYHGGEPIRVLRPFLEGNEQKPFFLSMTAAGQSALNVQGLDTVVIDDTRFTNIIEKGKNVLTRLHLGANEILQMAGRVHGRVEGGRVFILSDRDIDFASLKPTEPEFQLAGDSERVAITCADLGVRADELDLPVELDRRSYRDAVALLEQRGIIENGRLSQYGKSVEAMPVDRPWAELLVNADDALVPYLAVMSAVESLHRMTREDRNLDGLVVQGSDHLTAYNVYADAYREAGYVGAVYGLQRHLFHADSIEEWAERRGVLVKAVEDAALGMASVYRGVGLPLPTELPLARESTLRSFADLLARFMPFDLVIDEETREGREARVSKTSVCGSWGAIAGSLRYFADRFGVPRASIEGTQVPMELIYRNATRAAPEIAYEPTRKHGPLVLRRKVSYFAFELGAESETLDEWTPEQAPLVRRVLAAALAREEARHPAAHKNKPAIEEVREAWRRSGGRTPKLGQAELAAYYERQLADVGSHEEFRALRIAVRPDEFVPLEERARLRALPGAVSIRDRDVEIDYDIEETSVIGDAAVERVGVARLRLPEKLARSLTEDELPVLDRPLRFTVLRGQRGAVRAASLADLQEILHRPWSPDEWQEHDRPDDDHEPARERAARLAAREQRESRQSSQSGGERGRGRAREGAGKRYDGSSRSGSGRGGDRTGRGRSGADSAGGPGARPGGRKKGGGSGRRRRG